LDISLLSNRGFHGSILSATNHQASYKESDGYMANHNVKYSITITFALESLIDFQMIQQRKLHHLLWPDILLEQLNFFMIHHLHWPETLLHLLNK
jgi:hypothetical protein